MVDIWSPEAFWLTVTNIAIGVVCAALIAAAVVALVLDVRDRSRGRGSPRMVEDRTFHVPGLGETMADGGERYVRAPHHQRPRAA